MAAATATSLVSAFMASPAGSLTDTPPRRSAAIPSASRNFVTISSQSSGDATSEVGPSAMRPPGFSEHALNLPGNPSPAPQQETITPSDRKRSPMATPSKTSTNLSPNDGVVIVDHGSRRPESNEMLHLFVDMYKQKTGHGVVEAAHMELAAPSISDAFDRCVEQGAERVIICPYFFFPGKHWDRDIPALAARAAAKHPGVPYVVTAPIGLHEGMVKVIADRMEYCLSRVAGSVAECDMCVGTGRCKQIVASQPTSAGTPSTNSTEF